MKSVFPPVLCFVFFGWLGQPSAAWAKEYKIDAPHSSVSFSIRHLVSKVRGRFEKFEGVIDYDKASPAKSKVEAKIEVGSIDTDNKKRDDHLRSEDFFDEDKFPEIKFVSKKVQGKGKSLKISGDLTLHGVTKSVTIPVKVMGPMADGEKERIGFSGSTRINRKDFGIVWNKALDQGGLMLGDEVEIELEIAAISQASEKK